MRHVFYFRGSCRTGVRRPQMPHWGAALPGGGAPKGAALPKVRSSQRGGGRMCDVLMCDVPRCGRLPKGGL
ncbi:hypothetical protein JCM31598_13050 [Desulfonatronum parangueonense]